MSTKKNTKKTSKGISKYYTNRSIRKRVDKLLEANAILEATLGIDSTVSEWKSVKRQQRANLLKIKEFDVDFYKSIIIDD